MILNVLSWKENFEKIFKFDRYQVIFTNYVFRLCWKNFENTVFIAELNDGCYLDYWIQINDK